MSPGKKEIMGRRILDGWILCGIRPISV